MAGPVACRASRLISYSGSRSLGHCRRLTPLSVLLLSSLCSGCAVSGHLGSLFGDGNDAQARADVTGSVGKPAKDAAASASAALPDADLAFAKIAATEVLARGAKDASAPWENPKSGARGTVTPIAVAYTHEGSTCRDFLASHVSGAGREAWYQGEACRGGQGRWEVRTLKPWKRS